MSRAIALRSKGSKGGKEDALDSSGSAESSGGNEEGVDVDQQVLRALELRKPWNQIARELHVSPKTIQRINEANKEKKKALQGFNGLPVDPSGVVASEAFRLFERGGSPVDAVVKQRLPPEKAEELYGKWVALKEKDLSTPNVAKAVRELQEKVRSLSASSDRWNVAAITVLYGLGETKPLCPRCVTNELQMSQTNGFSVCPHCGFETI